MVKKVTLLIPLTFNDGSPVPEQLLDAIEQEIYGSFNGWTAVGEVAGAYKMSKTGEKKLDRLLQVWVVVNEEDIPVLQRMVAKFGAMLDQELMYFEVTNSVVGFIASDNKVEESNGKGN
jgi:hypothetical protein